MWMVGIHLMVVTYDCQTAQLMPSHELTPEQISIANLKHKVQLLQAWHCQQDERIADLENQMRQLLGTQRGNTPRPAAPVPGSLSGVLPALAVVRTGNASRFQRVPPREGIRPTGQRLLSRPSVDPWMCGGSSRTDERATSGGVRRPVQQPLAPVGEEDLEEERV